MKVLIGTALLLTAASSYAAPPYMSDGRLVDEHGMTLYIFSGQGAPDAKSCEGDCPRNFPPALASPGDTPNHKLGLVHTTEGARQWTYDGKPLYRGLMDKKPGDRAGDGLNTVWHSVQAH
ncbi:regulatory protein ChrI [Caballeronia novacaledonica]|uniref:COG4315 family predicted lipoprotein n=1 Tax=Caballeronia novacaledonica TaxID=1544861 RepID=UPI001EE1D17F|nr:transcriptional regulator [Caballeronia novacaledonica]GJH13078.1 regulatory protein ChrI [Caballeronia novacaledonica]